MRAYSIHRPIGPFTWPSQHRDKVVEVKNFDHLVFVPEIGRNAFGYIDFSEDIPKEDLDRYEMLVPEYENPVPESVVRALWSHAADEDFERWWDKALAMGYDEEKLVEAFDKGYPKYGR